jgi:hypothetical protein
LEALGAGGKLPLSKGVILPIQFDEIEAARLKLTTEDMKKQWDEIDRLQKQFISSFREGAGRVWDDFFVRGQNILASLANVIKGLLNTIGRTLFQNFATGLLTGSKQGAGGGIGGAIGNFGAGIGAKAGLGALFGTATPGLAAGATGATAISLATATPHIAATGLTGALGLSGGAGLLGLGAATIPVFGGIALGIFGLYKLFHQGQAKVQMTNDPFQFLGNRTMWFNTTFPYENLRETVATLERTVARLSGAIDSFESLDEGVLVKNGLPGAKAAIQSMNLDSLGDRKYRRRMAGAILEDTL